MQSMRERAELSGGTYTVTSAVGQGTKVCVGWPAFKATGGDRDKAVSCGPQSGVTFGVVGVRACYCFNASDGAQERSGLISG